MEKFTFHTSTEEQSQEVRRNLTQFNKQTSPKLAEGYEDVSFHVCDESGSIVAGVNAEKIGNWVEISILWVSEQYRKDGLGSQIIKKIEQIAIDNKCLYLKLDTFGFQALGFYQKQGYEVFGKLDNSIEELTHYYLVKYFDYAQ